MAAGDLAEVKGVGRRDKDRLQNPPGEDGASRPRGEPGTVWIGSRGVFRRGDRGNASAGILLERGRG